MAHLLLCLSRRLPSALAAVQQAQILHSASAIAAAELQVPPHPALQQEQHPGSSLPPLLDRLRSNHTASCSHDHAGHKKGAAVSFEEQEATCWSCHDRFHRGGLVCQACDKIQPSDPTLTHFDILGM